MSKKKQKTSIQIVRDAILNFVTDEWWLGEHRPPECDCAELAEHLVRVAQDEATTADEKGAASELCSILRSNYDIDHAAPHFDALLVHRPKSFAADIGNLSYADREILLSFLSC